MDSNQHTQPYEETEDEVELDKEKKSSLTLLPVNSKTEENSRLRKDLETEEEVELDKQNKYSLNLLTVKTEEKSRLRKDLEAEEVVELDKQKKSSLNLLTVKTEENSWLRKDLEEGEIWSDSELTREIDNNNDNEVSDLRSLLDSKTRKRHRYNLNMASISFSFSRNSMAQDFPAKIRRPNSIDSSAHGDGSGEERLQDDIEEEKEESFPVEDDIAVEEKHVIGDSCTASRLDIIRGKLQRLRQMRREDPKLCRLSWEDPELELGLLSRILHQEAALLTSLLERCRGTTGPQVNICSVVTC